MIREQAEKLLSSGLKDTLSAYGKVFVTGSCRMDMMCWNDLDLYMEDCEMLRENWFALVHDVCKILKPYRFDGFCNAGKFFFGCETDIIGERWNVDIWVKDRQSIENAMCYCAGIVSAAEKEPEIKTAILAIKKRLIELKMYGLDKDRERHYHSDEIYRAVLEEGVRTSDEFLRKYPK